ncbi:hypothetical protein [Providencia hangzhouensis]|uniref:hypothetical protein n=1 Tax=Providencia hangzhouensis TaxID=3031799 RepID=UPI0034DCD057
MKKAFICTKPVHLVSILDILNQGKPENSVLIIVDSFISAYDFFICCKENIKTLGFSECVFFKTELSASEYINLNLIDIVYSNWDLECWYYNLSKAKVITFDDGFFSYLKDFGRGSHFSLFLRYLKGFFKPHERCLLSHGKLTKGGFFFYHDYHKKIFPFYNKKRYSYTATFTELLNAYSDVLSKIYEPVNLNLSDYENKNIVLYLTSSNITKSEFNIVNDIECDILLVKPHPHIKRDDFIFDCFSHKIKSNAPAEIIFSMLVGVANKVTLVHSNSSIALHYSNDKSKVLFVNVCGDEIKKKKFLNMENFLKSGKK